MTTQSHEEQVAAVAERLSKATTPAGLVRVVALTEEGLIAHPTLVLDTSTWAAFLERTFCNSPYKDGPP